jgi:hypothetical protein
MVLIFSISGKKLPKDQKRIVYLLELRNIIASPINAHGLRDLSEVIAVGCVGCPRLIVFVSGVQGPNSKNILVRYGVDMWFGDV